MKHLFIGGYYDGHRMQVAPGIEQVVFDVPGITFSRRIIYTRRRIIDDGKTVFVFVLDTMFHENLLSYYLKLTKGK